MRRLAAVAFVLAAPIWLLLGAASGAACFGLGMGRIVRDLWRGK